MSATRFCSAYVHVAITVRRWQWPYIYATLLTTDCEGLVKIIRATAAGRNRAVIEEGGTFLSVCRAADFALSDGGSRLTPPSSQPYRVLCGAGNLRLQIRTPSLTLS